MSVLGPILRRVKSFRQTSVFYGILYIVFGACLYAMLVGHLIPERVDLKVLATAPKDLYSPIKIEDKWAMDRKRSEAIQKIEDQYEVKEQYKQNQIDVVKAFFDSIAAVNAEFQVKDNVGETTEEPASMVQVTANDKLEAVKKNQPKGIVKEIGDKNILLLLEASSSDLTKARDVVIDVISKTMSDKVTVDNVGQLKQNGAEKIRFTGISEELMIVLNDVLDYAIIPNYHFDSEKTQQLRKEAADSVEPLYILQGQLLVREGDVITNEIYEKLKTVGLLNQSSTFQPYLGTVLLVGLFLLFIHIIFSTGTRPWEDTRPSLVLFAVTTLIVISVMKMISLFQQIDLNGIGYIVPVAMGTFMIKLLLSDRYVFLMSFIISISGSIIFNEGVTGNINFDIGIYFLFSSLSVLLFLRGKSGRSVVLRAGSFVSLFNILVLFTLLLLKNGHYSWLELSNYGVMAILSGIASSVLTLGLLPYIEDAFGMISDLKLIELSKPTHKLLRKVLIEAPGTYHHSIMVANLSETACEAIGANGMLARVGAYYHDIGKTVQPHFFIENQLGILNPHDGLTPEESRDIIVAHVTDGVDILREARLPKAIIDIAEQHHGTTLLKFFYHKAKQEDASVKEDQYRYPGPKARSKEAAIVGIADSVEAAVRSLTPPTPEKIDQLIRAIVNDRLQDGQFSECDLTFQELEIVSQSLSESLKGIFHSRIKYPELKKEKGENSEH